MARTRGGGSSALKRKSPYNYGPPREKKQFSEHRRYSRISTGDHIHHGGIISKFSIKLATNLLQQNLDSENKNIICSPLSLDIVLNIIALGSKGATLEQLLDLVGCENVEEYNEAVSILGDVVREAKGIDGPKICSVNGLWVDQRHTFKELFQENLRELHKTEALAVDFVNQPNEVVKKANSWAKKQSKGLIEEILSKGCLNKDTIMLLANALYFKGTWVETFRHEATEDQEFYLLNRQIVRVPFMKKRTRYDYGTFEDCQVLRMLYNEEDVSEGEKRRSFSMYIFLPEKKDGLPDLLSKIPLDPIVFNDKIKLTFEDIKLALPKFKFQCELPIRTTMMEHGLTLPFDRDSAEITEMVESDSSDWPLYVDDIIQKSHVEVDEEGTKVVTYTRIQLVTMAARRPPPPPPINFVADHPFMFMIREDYSGAILHVGTILKP